MGKHGHIHKLLVSRELLCYIADIACYTYRTEIKTDRGETLKKNCLPVDPIQPHGVCACSGKKLTWRVRVAHEFSHYRLRGGQCVVPTAFWTTRTWILMWRFSWNGCIPEIWHENKWISQRAIDSARALAGRLCWKDKQTDRPRVNKHLCSESLT